MKVIEQPVQFKPVTIVLETPEELSLVNAVFAALTASRKATVSKVEVSPVVRKVPAHSGTRPAKSPEYYADVKGIIAKELNAGATKANVAKELNAKGFSTPTNLVWTKGRVYAFMGYYMPKTK